MIKLYDNGVYLLNGTEICGRYRKRTGSPLQRKRRRSNTMAYGILKCAQYFRQHGEPADQVRQADVPRHHICRHHPDSARVRDFKKFPIPYVLTNCHNSLCAVGGTINEDDHMFGLTCAKKYGGVYVPPHQAVIHQYAREMLAGGGKDDPRLRQPYALRRARDHGDGRGRTGACKAAS